MPRLRSKFRCTYRRAATIALCCTAIGSCGRADAHSLRGAAPEDSEDPDDSLTEEPGSTKDYLTKYFTPDADGFTVFDYDNVGLDANVRALALRANRDKHPSSTAEASKPKGADARASLVPRVVAAKQFSHFSEIHQTCPTFPFCNHIPAPPPILPNPADFVVRNTIAEMEDSPSASKLPATYWNPHKLPLQAQVADQDQSELTIMTKGRNLKLPVQIEGDPKRWLPPPRQFPLYRHAIGNIAWDAANDANSAHVLPTPNDAEMQNELASLGDLAPVSQDVYQPINVDTHTDNMYNNGPVPLTDIDGPIRKQSPASQFFRSYYKKYISFPPPLP
mmetsp:Transcript_50788/g.75269  ORF Transcript_50788/g.75269 Transcript_50788/m.75269 type:complete len:334 (+) Transcript_50788:78-1079(+)